MAMNQNRWRGSARMLTLAAVLPIVFGALAMRVAGQAGSSATPAPTFTKDIAPILQRSCQTCHRPGGAGPMPLTTYEETRPWARSIKHRTSLVGKPDVMPPWFIDKEV